VREPEKSTLRRSNVRPQRNPAPPSSSTRLKKPPHGGGGAGWPFRTLVLLSQHDGEDASNDRLSICTLDIRLLIQVDLEEVVCPSASNEPKSCSWCGSLSWQKLSKTDSLYDAVSGFASWCGNAGVMTATTRSWSLRLRMMVVFASMMTDPFRQSSRGGLSVADSDGRKLGRKMLGPKGLR